ncbi:hypothetical protein AAFF_G00182920, partial [Aldrovandia affinis]
IRQYVNDIVKIYSITVTNAQDGVASSCHACALLSQQPGSSCIPCPAGHYVDKDTNQCIECPPDTYLSGHQIYGKEACLPCGPGSRSNKVHSACFSNCSFSHTGTKYFHFFNISLSGPEGERAAICNDNVTDLSNENLLRESSDFVNNVETFICQSTIIPSDGRGFRTAVSSQSISLADIFLGATMENSLNGISVSPDLFPKHQGEHLMSTSSTDLPRQPHHVTRDGMQSSRCGVTQSKPPGEN